MYAHMHAYTYVFILSLTYVFVSFDAVYMLKGIWAVLVIEIN